MNLRSNSSFIVLCGANSIDFASSFERLRDAVDFDQAMITTTLPRGGLQVAQAHRVDSTLSRAYSREHHALDAVAWQALVRARPVRWSDVRQDRRQEAATTRLRERLLKPLGMAQYASAPLAGPLFEGFPGVLHIFRGQNSRDFSLEELELLGRAAEEVAEATTGVRRARGSDEEAYAPARSMDCRQIVIDRSGRVLFPGHGEEAIEPSIRHRLIESVQQRITADDRESKDEEHGNGRPRGSGDRGPDSMMAGAAPGAAKSSPLTVPDESGEQWVFRLVIFGSQPALSGGVDEPVAVVSLPPACDAWALIRSEDMQADPELARLVPAIHYMHRNFASGINLAEVARSVHLSPFHFHRRFTELLGTTPKHFLFDCQIAHAKRHLARGEKPLAEIASEAGFAHQSHFTSRFRQATGLTPTKWKRLALQIREQHEAAH